MTATASNVIPIDERTGFLKPTELKLVRKCVDCGAALAADTASYSIDPDFNNTTASAAVRVYADQAYKLLNEITKTPARTADGL